MAEPIIEVPTPAAERVIPVSSDTPPSQPLSNSPMTPAPLSAIGLKASSSSDLDMLKVFCNIWHPTHNPTGYVNLGVAENSLMHSTLTTYINSRLSSDASTSINGVTPMMLTYGDGGMGSTRLRETIARFLTRHLKPLVDITAEHVIVTNGCSSAIEQCAFLMSEPGECWLLGQPYYGTFPLDLTLRPGAVVLPVAFGEDVDPLSIEGVKKYEETLLKAQREGKKVRGLVLCHPHNPLGRCYPREVIKELMRFCGRYGLQFISDEIYALSVWENNEDDLTDACPPVVPFVSSATIDPVPLGLAPQNHHILWALSKDFGANGLRLGVVISQHNEEFIRALTLTSFYSYISSLVDNLACNILSDDVFTDSYIAENQKLLSAAYSRTCRILRDKKIPYEKGGNAAFFLWMDLGKYYIERHPNWRTTAKQAKTNGAEESDEKKGESGDEDDEHALTGVIMDALMEAKVFLASGTAFGSERPGWFRLVFSQEESIVDEGIERIVAALK